MPNNSVSLLHPESLTLTESPMNLANIENTLPTGKFVNFKGENHYAIYHSNKIPPFFSSIVSNSDHWLFISSTGGLTAGRVSPETALFPYVSVDKIHENYLHSGPKTIIQIWDNEVFRQWEPFNREHQRLYNIQSNIYKNLAGNKIYFEEINHDLQLVFRYSWSNSDSFGFIRQCEVENLSNNEVDISLVDGLQNILPAGTPRHTQTNSSNLVDAYKWNELEPTTGLAFFTLYSGITDRAEPCESLKANTVFSIGLTNPVYLLSSEQLNDFRNGKALENETHKRGIRGAYLVQSRFNLSPRSTNQWQLVADIEQSQKQCIALSVQLQNIEDLVLSINQSIEQGNDELARIMASADGFQLTAEKNVYVHHYANVLYNILRGGIFNKQYSINSFDFADTLKQFNQQVYYDNLSFIESLADEINFKELLTQIKQQNNLQLERLCYEYLPITFGRRHGDPSRPWNQFEIKLKDPEGKPILFYQGNWRDIFQNWEALTFSYPDFIESIIAKFVNASTIDGYNPYRITKEGIDWEIEDPDDPWSYIGYWGDHQIIYLLRLLELSRDFHPGRLKQLLKRQIFSYANVPYRIKSFDQLQKNAKSTIIFEQEKASLIEKRIEKNGLDGKLVLDQKGEVHLVNLLEKLLVPLLSKLGNFVIDGGIWLNTQRPEWNDANNAIVGHGLSMVTLFHIRRYVCFLQTLTTDEQEVFSLSSSVYQLLEDNIDILAKVTVDLNDGKITPEQRWQSMVQLGKVSCRFRHKAYQFEGFDHYKEVTGYQLNSFFSNVLIAVDHTIATNRRKDQLFNAYNLLNMKQGQITVNNLYPMLEGQVAALSSGALSSVEAISVIEALYKSKIYRADQKSFMLYPDRQLPGFLDKNRLTSSQVNEIPLLKNLISEQDYRIIEPDDEGNFRFTPNLLNAEQLLLELEKLPLEHLKSIDQDIELIQDLYETTFNHKAFTGRSGSMFGFEGLGCIYWHMVSKLLLAILENYYLAVDNQEEPQIISKLTELYYQVREGIGFNKSPVEYGAFPTDPYSHTPKHAGAQQPGMTGQVKEEVLSRFGELGIRVNNGKIKFQPGLLRKREFCASAGIFRYLNTAGNWQEVKVPENALAFTWCQIPIIYQLSESIEPTLTVFYTTDQVKPSNRLVLSEQQSSQIFLRDGSIKRIVLELNPTQLYME